MVLAGECDVCLGYRILRVAFSWVGKGRDRNPLGGQGADRLFSLCVEKSFPEYECEASRVSHLQYVTTLFRVDVHRYDYHNLTLQVDTSMQVITGDVA